MTVSQFVLRYQSISSQHILVVEFSNSHAFCKLRQAYLRLTHAGLLLVDRESLYAGTEFQGGTAYV